MATDNSTENSDDDIYANESFEYDSDDTNNIQSAAGTVLQESLQLTINSASEHFDALKLRRQSRQSLSCRPTLQTASQLSDDEAADSDSADVVMGNHKFLSIDTHSMNFDEDLSSSRQILTPIRRKFISSRGRLQHQTANGQEEGDEDEDDINDDDDEDDDEEYQRIRRAERLYKQNMRLSANRKYPSEDKIEEEDLAKIEEDEDEDEDDDDIDDHRNDYEESHKRYSETSEYEEAVEMSSQCSELRKLGGTGEQSSDEDTEIEEDHISDERNGDNMAKTLSSSHEDQEHSLRSEYETANDTEVDEDLTYRCKAKQNGKMARMHPWQEMDDEDEEEAAIGQTALEQGINSENIPDIGSELQPNSEMVTNDQYSEELSTADGDVDVDVDVDVDGDVDADDITPRQTPLTEPVGDLKTQHVRSYGDIGYNLSKEVETHLQSNIANILQSTLIKLKPSDKEIVLTHNMLGPSTLDETFKKLNLGVPDTSELAKTMIKAVKDQVLREQEKRNNLGANPQEPNDAQSKGERTSSENNASSCLSGTATEDVTKDQQDQPMEEQMRHRIDDGAGDGFYDDSYTDYDEIQMHSYGDHLPYGMETGTPSYFNSDDYLCQSKDRDLCRSSNVRQTRSTDGIKAKPYPRKSMSFSNERMREIERHNQILLRKILSQKPTYSSKPAPPLVKKKNTPDPPMRRPSSAAVNRKKQQRKIDQDNLVLKRKLEAISVRRSSLYF